MRETTTLWQYPFHQDYTLAAGISRYCQKLPRVANNPRATKPGILGFAKPEGSFFPINFVCREVYTQRSERLVNLVRSTTEILYKKDCHTSVKLKRELYQKNGMHYFF